MTSNPSQWQYLFSPDVSDNRSATESRKIKLHPDTSPTDNVIEVTVTNINTQAADKKYFRLIEVSPTWKEV